MGKRIILLLLSVFCLSTFTYGVDAWIRINQLGYLPDAPKKAILLSETPLRITNFTIHDALTNCKLGTFGSVTDKGEFQSYKSTYILDFSDFKTQGAFYIKAGLIYSPVIYINKNTYLGSADLLLNYFRGKRLDTNQPGNDYEITAENTKNEPVVSPETQPLASRAKTIKTPRKTTEIPLPEQFKPTPVDVKGGWLENADETQYGATSANAVYQMLFAYQMNPASFSDEYDADGQPGQNRIPDIVDEAKWGLDWLLKMYPDKETLYYQIAQNESKKPNDNDRTVYPATGKPQGSDGFTNLSNGFASVAGKYSSAFSLGAEILAPFYPDYAETLKSKATTAYELGKKHPGVCQSIPLKSSINFAEDNWTDDMELAATQLYRLTYEGKYLRDAAGYGRMEPVSPWMCSDTARHYQWYPFINLGHYMLANVENPRHRQEYTQNLLNGIQRMSMYAQTNPFNIGIPMIRCSNNLVVALATQCRLYRSLTSDTAYLDMENALVDWLFGRNPWGSTMIAGLPKTGTTSAYTLANTENKNAHLAGALANGPVGKKVSTISNVRLTKNDPGERHQSEWAVYHNDTPDKLTNAPTLDGTASLSYLLAARQQDGVPGKTADCNQYTYGGITRTDARKKQISLLFCEDEFTDGYKTIRKNLKKLNIKASFFFTGNFYRKGKFKKIIKGLQEDGHYLGAYSDKNPIYCSWRNRDSLLISKTEFLNDIRANYASMEKFGIHKNQTPFFLPPRECYNDSISAWCREIGLQLVSHTPGTLSSCDNSTPEMREKYFSSNEIYNKILQIESKQGLNGYILLFHLGADKRRQDKFYPRLYSLLIDLSKAGYDFVDLYRSTDVIDRNAMPSDKKQKRKN